MSAKRRDCLVRFLLTICVLLSGPKDCKSQEILTGEFSKVTYQTGPRGKSLNCFCVGGDQRGFVYVSDREGVVRLDGTRSTRIMNIENDDFIRKFQFNGSNAMYGLSLESVYYWRTDGDPQRAIVVSLNDVLDRPDIGGGPRAFREISRVGNDVYLVKTNVAIRLRLNPSGVHDIKVFPASRMLPEDMKFRRVVELDGKALFQMESKHDVQSVRLGWLVEESRIELAQEITFEKTGKEFTQHITDLIRFDDNSNRILAACNTKLFVIEKKGKRFVANPFFDEDTRLKMLGPAPSWIRHVVKLNANSFAIRWERRGVLILDFDGRLVTEIPLKRIPLMAEGIYVDGLGRLWIPHGLGVTRVDCQETIRHWTTPGNNRVLSSEFFDGALLLGTKSGLYVAKVSEKTGLPIEEFEMVPSFDGIISDLKTIDDCLYICDPMTPSLSVVSSLDELTHPTHINNGDTGVDTYWRVISSGTKDSIYVGTLTRGIVQFTFSDGLWNARPIESKGTVVTRCMLTRAGCWFTTNNKQESHFVERIDRKTGRLDSFAMASKTIPFLFDSNVMVGLSHEYDPVTNSVIGSNRLQAAFRGSGSTRIGTLLSAARASNGDALLTTTNASVLRVSMTKSGPAARRVFGGAMGVPAHFAIEGARNFVWAVFENKIYCRYSLEKSNPILDPPQRRILFTEIALLESNSDDSQSPTKPIELEGGLASRSGQFDFTSDTLRLRFAVPTVSFPSRILYQSRMIGVSDRWSGWTDQPFRDFVALREGGYQFEVRAKFADDRISQSSFATFNVAPPWHRSYPFYIVVVGIGSIGIWGLIRWRLVRHQAQIVRLENEVKAREQVEEKLRDSQIVSLRQERLRAAGEMAAGVAHDVNNALGPATIYCGIIGDNKAMSVAETKKFVSLISNCVSDASDIIGQLHPLYSSSAEKRSQIDLSILCQEAVEAAKVRCSRGKKSVEFRLDVEQTLLVCAATDVREVLINVLNNAVDAIQRKGSVEIRCYTFGHRVQIDVTDSGCGMSEVVLQRCVESFYSTKENRGTGLGLATSQAVLATYNGKMLFHSKVGVGTRVEIRIPIDQNMPNFTPVRTAQSDLAPSKILLVDDFQETLFLTQTLLASLNQEVVAVTNATEALEKLHQSDFDILLTDYKMPNMNGFELSQKVRSGFRHIPIILMSGFEEPGIREVCDVFLKKPFTINSIHRALEIVQREDSR